MRTDAPYELEMTDDGGKVTQFQIYRRDGLRRDQFSAQGAGVMQTTLQTIFPLSTKTAAGKEITYTWSTPTDRYFFDGSDLVSHVVTKIDGKETSADTYKFHFISTETVSVGPCNFTTKHYAVDYGRHAGLVSSDAWFSVDLRAALRTRSTIVRNGLIQILTLQATNVSLDVKPLR